MAYWLMKSEPTTFGIDHLQKSGEYIWDGVRNYQARNFLRQMKKGDQAYFYHSNTKVPGIVGQMEISREGYADPTQFNPEHKYYDAKSMADNPRWTAVDVKFIEKWPFTLSLEELRHIPALQNLALLRKGNRLSLMPLTTEEWQAIQQAYQQKLITAKS